MRSLTRSILAKSNQLLKKTKNVSETIYKLFTGGFISKSQHHNHKRKQNKSKSTRKKRR